MRHKMINSILRISMTGSLRHQVSSYMMKRHLPMTVSTFPQQLSIMNQSKFRHFTTSPEWSDDKFNQVLQDDTLVVFMKGTPDQPMCGFSKYVIQILNMHGCQSFKTLNVLEDDELRSRVKEFSNWPTIPQIYINGEFIGGFDILLQMHQNGELIEELEKIGHRSALIDAENEDS